MILWGTPTIAARAYYVDVPLVISAMPMATLSTDVFTAVSTNGIPHPIAWCSGVKNNTLRFITANQDTGAIVWVTIAH